MTTAGQLRIDRREFVAALVAAVPEDTLFVSGLGSPSYDLYAAGDRDRNFYLWGAMGGAVPVGLGLALAQPGVPVVVLTGDGEQLMGVGALASVGAQQPANLSIIVLDNGHFGETGMQPSHTSLGTDLVTIAQGSGITDGARIERQEEVIRCAHRVARRTGPTFTQVLISTDEPPRAMPARDGVFVKNRLRAALGFDNF